MLQQRLQIRQLVINVDKNSLESARGWMLSFLPGRIGVFDNLRQTPGAGKRFFLPFGHNGPRHAPGETLSAVLFQYPTQFGFAGTVDPLGGALTARLVHAPIKGAMLRKAKAPLGMIKLWRGQDRRRVV